MRAKTKLERLKERLKRSAPGDIEQMEQMKTMAMGQFIARMAMQNDKTRDAVLAVVSVLHEEPAVSAIHVRWCDDGDIEVEIERK